MNLANLDSAGNVSVGVISSAEYRRDPNDYKISGETALINSKSLHPPLTPSDWEKINDYLANESFDTGYDTIIRPNLDDVYLWSNTFRYINPTNQTMVTTTIPVLVVSTLVPG